MDINKLKQIYNERKITDRENNLLEKLREIPYGEVTIFMENSQPVRIIRAKESIKL